MTRTTAILVVLALTGAAALASSGCSVHRRSEDLVTCATDFECFGLGGFCDHGYCVTSPSGCPSPCTECDLVALTCRIECNTTHVCGDVKCPAGFDCTFKCNNAACGDIDCALARRCTIDCSGAAACHNINCGGGACEISCSGPAACPSIDCAASCQCNVSCNTSGAACPSMSCPMSDGGTPCTRSGTPGTNCDSAPPGCDRCPNF